MGGAVYRTVRTVLWEVGHSINGWPPTRFKEYQMIKFQKAKYPGSYGTCLRASCSSILGIITLTLLQQKQKFNIILLMHQRVGGQDMNKEEQVIMGFRNLYNKMAWLNNFQMKDRFEDYKSSEVHCIEYIGRNADSNVTKLAESFYMTRGAISKMTRKLMNKGAIESYQKPENKKEVYFKLTEQGKVIYNVHDELHKEFQERDKAIFEQVTEEQFNIMLGFLEKYSWHLDEEIKKQGVEITN
jgi:DNA-binding MarR family transcriptional regulator